MTDQEEWENELELEPERAELKESWLKRNLVCLTLVFLAFLIGLMIMGWQYRKASSETQTLGKEITDTKNLLQREKIKVLLSNALIEVQRGEYDLAFIDASKFFNSLKSEIDKDEGSAYSIEEKRELRKIFENRDMTIASIARREETAVEKLSVVYLSYLKAIGEYRKSGEKIRKPSLDNENTDTNANVSADTNIDNQNGKTEISENTNGMSERNENPNIQNANINNINVNQNP